MAALKGLWVDVTGARAALDNSALILAAAADCCRRGVPLELPRGSIGCAVDLPANPRLVIRGAGADRTRLVSPGGTAAVLSATGFDRFSYVTWYTASADGRSLQADPNQPPPRPADCLYNWTWDDGPSRRRYVVRAVDAAAGRIDLDRPVEPLPDPRWKWTAGRALTGAVPPGTDRVTLTDPAHAGLFPAGRPACLYFGPYQNESDCEFLRVAAVEGSTVIFDRPARRGCEDGAACLIPGPFNTGVALEGFSVGGSAAGAYGYWRACPGLRVEGVEFVGGGSWPFSLAATTGAAVRGCRVDGALTLNACQDVSVDGLSAWNRPAGPGGPTGGLGCEEGVFDLAVTNCTLGGLYNGTPEGGRHALCNVTVRSPGVAVSLAPDTLAANLRQTGGAAWYLNSDSCTLAGVAADVPVFVRGRGVLIGGGHFPAGITFEAWPAGWGDLSGRPSSGVATLSPDTPYRVMPGCPWDVRGGAPAS